LCDNVLTVPQAVLGREAVGRLDEVKRAELDRALRYALGILIAGRGAVDHRDLLRGGLDALPPCAELFDHDLAAERDALIADPNAGASHDLGDLLMRLATE
jgi:hypothetical protein